MASRWGHAGEGALEYGSTGAGIGMKLAGGPGAAIGGAIGAGYGGIKNWLGWDPKKHRSAAKAGGGGAAGSIPGYDVGRIDTRSPEMIQAAEGLAGQLEPGSFLYRLAMGDPEIMAQMEEGDLEKFQSILGGIGSRFGGASGGGLGKRQSTAFQQGTTGAAENFAKQLRSQRLQLQKDAMSQINQMTGTLLGQRPYEIYSQKQQPSFLSQLGSELAGEGTRELVSSGTKKFKDWLDSRNTPEAAASGGTTPNFNELIPFAKT